LFFSALAQTIHRYTTNRFALPYLMKLKDLPFPRSGAYLLLIIAGGVLLGSLVHRFDSPPSLANLRPARSFAESTSKPKPSPASAPSIQPKPSSLTVGNATPVDATEPSQKLVFRPTPATPKPAQRPEPVSGNILGKMSPSLARMVLREGSQGTLPVALTELPEGVTFSAEQSARLSQMGEAFIAAVGGENQNPDDPAYKRRWQEAQWVSDQEFRAYFGSQLFAEVQRQAYLLKMKDSAESK